MSVSVFIAGQRDEDGRLRGMANLKTECDRMGLSYPPELIAYFEGTEALEHDSIDAIVRCATEVNLKYELKVDGLIEGDPAYGEGAIIDLSKLPTDICRLRVYMR